MAKKKSTHSEPGRLPPDHPIFKEGLVIYTPIWARPGYKPPEPKEEPEEEVDG